MRHHTTLRFIDAIARHGSIRRAAEALAITPSALNRRLLALEDELDAPLFERQARGVRLSAAGEIFVHHARRQMADMARVRAGIEDMKGARRGHVAIALDACFPSGPLARMIAVHRERHPGVTFSILACDRGDVAALLEDYRADVALVVEPDAGRGFTTLATLPLGVEVVASAERRIVGRTEPRLADLVTEPLVLPPEGRSLRYLVDMAALRRDVALDPVATADEAVASRLIAAGAAVGLRLAVPGDIAPDLDPIRAIEGVRAIPLRPHEIRATLHLGQLRERSLPVPAARFAEAIRRRMDELDGAGRT